MSRPTEQKVWILNEPPAGEIQQDTFKQETRPLPKDLKDGELLVKVDFLSNDPAQRTWMQKDVDERRLYQPPIKKGDYVRSNGLATVLESKSSKWKTGQKVSGHFGWYDYGVASEQFVSSEVVDEPGHPLLSLTVLGLTGKTAWVGLFDILKVKKEHTLVVSGAAGAVGSVVVQIAKKVVGCKKVVGIAGGPEKCKWVKSLGADDCVDYKDPAYTQHLAKLLPDYADIYFENVGGDVLNNMLPLVKRFGSIAVCGAIANYNGKKQELSNFGEIVYNRLDMKGFIVLDHLASSPQMGDELKKWFDEGKIDDTEGAMVVDTKFEDIPKTWQMLFSGGNRGKLVSKLL